MTFRFSGQPQGPNTQPAARPLPQDTPHSSSRRSWRPTSGDLIRVAILAVIGVGWAWGWAAAASVLVLCAGAIVVCRDDRHRRPANHSGKAESAGLSKYLRGVKNAFNGEPSKRTLAKAARVAAATDMSGRNVCMPYVRCSPPNLCTRCQSDAHQDARRPYTMQMIGTHVCPDNRTRTTINGLCTGPSC